MRLSQQEIEAIVRTAQQRFGTAPLYLFGSRANDTKAGGDIDLFLQASKEVPLPEKLAFLVALQRQGIERKVDLVIASPQHSQEKIRREVAAKGLRLC